jgi:hypothetical protein
MQKKQIAIAIAALVSSTAFAQTSVSLGGKFDACYSFTRTSGVDSATGGATGSTTSETQTEGCNDASRITVLAREEIAKDYNVRIDFDLRFGNVHEGTAGVSSNNKKAMAFATPFGTLQWGTASLMSGDYKLAEKPYMVSPRETELVKGGISLLREDSLTNRNTSFWSPVWTIGPVKTLMKGTYAFSDARKAGSNDQSSSGSGDVFVIGNEGVILDRLIDWGVDYTRRLPTGSSSYTGGYTSGSTKYPGGMIFTHAYVELRPFADRQLKLTAQFNTYRGYNANEAGGTFREKNTNFVVSYNFNGMAELGVGVSHLNDLGESRNSGRRIMIGGSYLLSRGVQIYAGMANTTFDYNQGSIAGGKYVGTSANFSSSLTKLDTRVLKFGLMKDF